MRRGTWRLLDAACLAALVILSVAVGLALAGKARSEQRRVEATRALLSMQNRDLAAAQAGLDQLNQVFQSFQGEMAAIQRRLPDGPALGAFIRHLDALIVRREMNLVSLQPQSPETEGDLVRIPMRLMLTGPFVRAYELVYDLETMDRLLHIEKLSLMRGAGFEDCRVDLSFSIYHF